MAFVESDREDLMREATAFPRRAECRVPGRDEIVFAGLRETGTSIYFGLDPVYHLDADNRLRRAFVDGDLYRTQGTTLAQLTRHRGEEGTELHRRDLPPNELATFLDRCRNELGELADSIESGGIERLASLPIDDDPWPYVAAAIRRHLALERPLAPAIPGRR